MWQKLMKFKIPLFIGFLIVFKIGTHIFDTIPPSSFNTFQNDEKNDEKNVSNFEDENNESKKEKNNNSQKFVDIKGSVKKPGVYEFKDNERIFQVLEKAGGFVDANKTCINLADTLVDKQILYIPAKSEKCKTESNKDNSDNKNFNKGNEANNGSKKNDNKININKASKDELLKLSGIGSTRADDIIKYRNEHQFQTIEEIQQIDGIGVKTYSKIKDQITV